MNIAYAIWLENLQSPILKSQVFDILKEINKISFEKNIYIFAFQSVIHLLRHYKELNEIKRNMKSNNINLIIIPCLILPRYINWFSAQWYIVPFIFLFSFPILLFLVYYKSIDILHCRSYPVMLAAITTKKIRKNIKLIFDPRSPFPEENITANRWNASSFSYKLWKNLEKQFLKDSDITVAITDTYVKHFKKISPRSGFAIIPNNVDVKRFMPNDKLRMSHRAELHLNDDEIIFAYSGSMGNHWNNPNIYAKFIIKLRQLNIKHRFLFLTPDKKVLKEIFDKYNIKKDEYFNICVEFNNVPKYLSIADFGINLMDKKDIRMSTKTCEYLAMGLPVVINLNVLGAKEIVEKYNVGLVIKDINKVNIEEVEEIINGKDSISLECRKLAIEKFSNEKIARQYVDIYKRLSKY